MSGAKHLLRCLSHLLEQGPGAQACCGHERRSLSTATSSACRVASMHVLTRLCPLAMMRPSRTRTHPTGTSPSASAARASWRAACMKSRSQCSAAGPMHPCPPLPCGAPDSRSMTHTLMVRMFAAHLSCVRRPGGGHGFNLEPKRCVSLSANRSVTVRNSAR